MWTAVAACQLLLTYAPAGVDNGTLNLSYSYLNNAGEAKSGTVGIPYQTTTNDNVAGSANPATVGGESTGSSNAVTVTFTTDDGNFASGLSADLSALRARLECAGEQLHMRQRERRVRACQVALNLRAHLCRERHPRLWLQLREQRGHRPKPEPVSIPYSAAP